MDGEMGDRPRFRPVSICLSNSSLINRLLFSADLRSLSLLAGSAKFGGSPQFTQKTGQPKGNRNRHNRGLSPILFFRARAAFNDG
jgi:hypothetical protein